jgi:hypothetical protein
MDGRTHRPSGGNRRAARAAAFSAYVYEGRDLEAIALELQVPLGTLKRWASDGRESPDRKSWAVLRAEVDRDKTALTSRFYRLTSQTLDDALKSRDPQKIYAATNAFRAVQSPPGGNRGLRQSASSLAEADDSPAAAAAAGADVIWAALQEVPELARLLKRRPVREALKAAVQRRIAAEAPNAA